jgi:triosephosphate isomerase
MKIFVINWKMHINTHEAIAFCHAYKEELQQVASKVILCPPATALSVVGHELKKTEIALAGQSCSEKSSGDYTTQIAAINYAQVGCSYVLVGHHEERKDFNLDTRTIANKALQVINAGMIPLICIADTETDRKKESFETYLDAELGIIEEVLEGKPAYIIYQGAWTHKTDNYKDEIGSIFAFMKYRLPGYAFLYEGAIPEDDFHSLTSISSLCGFLVTETSTDFQMFKKIVSYKE